MLAALPATAVLVVGDGKDLDILPSGMVGLAVTLTGGWLFQSNRALVRWLAATVGVAAPVFVIVLYISQQLLWEVLLVVVLTASSAVAGRAAITRPTRRGHARTSNLPPRRPFGIMNPAPGGGRSASSH